MTIQIGQAKIKDHQIRAMRGERGQATLAVLGKLHAISSASAG